MALQCRNMQELICVLYGVQQSARVGLCNDCKSFDFTDGKLVSGRRVKWSM